MRNSTSPIVLLIICLSFNASMLKAQLIVGGSNSPGYKMATERPIVIVRSKDELLDETLENAFNKYWSLTPVTFINTSELKKYNFNKEYNLIVPVERPTSSFIYKHWDKDFTPKGLAMLVSVPDYTQYVDANMGMYFPNNDFIETFTDESLTFYDSIRISYMVGGMHSLYTAIEKYKLKGVMTTSYDDMYKEFNKIYASAIAKKTLLVLEDMTKPQGEENIIFFDPEVLKSYPYKYKIVSLEELNELSRIDAAGYCFMDMVVNNMNYIFIYDVATKAMLYGEMDINSSGIFDSKYFQNLVKAIQN